MHVVDASSLFFQHKKCRKLSYAVIYRQLLPFLSKVFFCFFLLDLRALGLATHNFGLKTAFAQSEVRVQVPFFVAVGVEL